MRIRYRIAIAVAVFVLIGAGAWRILYPREPSYDGKPLSYWLSQYGQWVGPSPRTQEDPKIISSALFHIGSNALPTLYKMLRARDSTFKLKVMKLAGRQHVVNFHFVSAGVRNQIAIRAHEDMDDQAVFAVPVLAEVYAREVAIVTNHPGQTDQAELLLYNIPKLLGELGPAASNAVPALALGISYTNSQFRHSALIALDHIRSYPDVALPALIQCLQDTDFVNCIHAELIIPQFGNRAAPALPAIFALLQDPEFEIREAAMLAIEQLKLRVDPAIAVPALTEFLGDPNTDVAREALSAIKLYGPDANSAVPAILDLLHRRETSFHRLDVSLRSEIKSALDQIDPEAADAVLLE